MVKSSNVEGGIKNLDEKEELENLKKLLFKTVRGDDVDLMGTITDYMEGFYKIKYDSFAGTITTGFNELKNLIVENHADTRRNIDEIKRELGLNGFGKKN